MKPDLSRVPAFYHRYINLVTESDLNAAFKKHQSELRKLLETIAEDKWNYRYAEGKWSVKELVQHIIDGERIFAYRALRFARKDQTPLAGFDENPYAAVSEADRRNKTELLEELATVQTSSAQLFSSFSEEQLKQTGIANGNSIDVDAIGYIIIGHVLHHKSILEERYLEKKTPA